MPQPPELVMKKDNTVFIGLGTNLGDREKNLKNAIADMQKFIAIEHISSIYETQPVGYEKQGWFLNMVIQGQTQLSPRHLLKKLKAVEKKSGRKPTFHEGPRIIDLDILFYADNIISCDDLIIPHPEIQNRGFVLTPLNEIAPGFIHPKLKKKINNLLNNLIHTKEVKEWTKTKC